MRNVSLPFGSCTLLNLGQRLPPWSHSTGLLAHSSVSDQNRCVVVTPAAAGQHPGCRPQLWSRAGREKGFSKGPWAETWMHTLARQKAVLGTSLILLLHCESLHNESTVGRKQLMLRGVGMGGLALITAEFHPLHLCPWSLPFARLAGCREGRTPLTL